MANNNNIYLYIFRLAIVFAAYFITARIGLSLDPVGGFATPVWPPTGIALASLVLFGYRMWPAIFMAAMLVNYSMGASIYPSLGIGFGNMIGPLLGAFIFNKAAEFKNLETLREALAIIFLSFFTSAITATIGTGSLWAAGELSINNYYNTWLAWWIGDSMGMLIIGSTLLLNWKRLFATHKTSKSIMGTIAIGVFLIFTNSIVFWGFMGWHRAYPFLVFYLIFTPLIWAALKSGQFGSVSALFIMTVMAVWGAINQLGPFAVRTVAENLYNIQVFMGVVGVNGLILGAVISEKKQIQNELEEYNQNLEKQVAIRTAELNKSEEMYRNLLDVAPDIISTMDDKGRITSLNSAWERITGWSRAESIGKSMEAFTHPDDLESNRKMFGMLLSGKDNFFAAESRVKAKSGEYIFMESNVFVMRENGRASSLLVVSRDITDRKKNEETLKEYREGLEQMVAERTRELKEKINELEKLNKFMVGRELKMVELKEENRLLKSEKEASRILNKDVESERDLNKFMVGRELEMVELKDENRQPKKKPNGKKKIKK